MKFYLPLSITFLFLLQTPVVNAANNTAKWPKIWMVDVTRTGDFCYNRPSDVRLWRSHSKLPQTLLITDRKNKQKVRLRWASKQNVQNWPHKKMPLKSGRVYLIQSGDRISTLSVNKIPAKLNTYKSISAWIEKQGCHHQTNVLKQMKNPAQAFK